MLLEGPLEEEPETRSQPDRFCRLYFVNFVTIRIERFISIMHRDGMYCPHYGIGGCPHFRGSNCTQVYVNAFGTMHSVCIIVNVCISGVSGRRGRTVVYNSLCA